MIEILKKKYWNKADAFIMPLTGLRKDNKFEVNSYLFWEEYSIEDFKLILKYNYTDYTKFEEYCRATLFPILDKNGYLLESYDCDDFSIFVLDLSDWSMNIQMFLAGKYSKLSPDAKVIIENYHQYYEKGEWKIPMHIFATLYPKGKKKDGVEIGFIEGLSPIEYVVRNYGFDEEAKTEIRKIGELSGIYEIDEETLTLECQEKPAKVAETM